MKKDIDHLLSKVAKVIKGGNFLYLVPKKERRNFGFIETALRLKAKKQDSLIFVRHGNRFTFRDEFEGLNFKGLLIYGSLSKLIKNSDMVKLNKRLKDRIILTPDLILYKTYSKEYIKILRFSLKMFYGEN